MGPGDGDCLRALEGHTDWIYVIALTADGRRALTTSGEGTARIWELDWDYKFPAPADSDEGARPHLQALLAAIGSGSTGPRCEEEIQRLLSTLRAAGYGWLREEARS